MNVLKIHVIKAVLTLMVSLHVHVLMDISWMRMAGVVMVCTCVDNYQLFTTVHFVYRY